MEYSPKNNLGSARIEAVPCRIRNRWKCTLQIDVAENLHGWRPPSGAKEVSRKVREVRKVIIDVTLAAEASKNLESAATTPTYWIAVVSAAEVFLSRKEHKEMKGGNGANNVSVVTLRRATGVNPWVYYRLHVDKPGSRQSPAAKGTNDPSKTETPPTPHSGSRLSQPPKYF